MDQTFAALSSDVRRQILVYLATGDLTLKQIRSRFPFTGPAILYHLRMLESARFVERRGQRYALISDNVIDAFNLFLSELDQHLPQKEQRQPRVEQADLQTPGLDSPILAI